MSKNFSLTRSRMWRTRAATALAAAGALVMSGGLVMLSAPTATATGDNGTPPGNPTKTGLCHRTASDSNPYVFIEVDDESLPAHLNDLPGHPAKQWKTDGTWRNVAHTAGQLKKDYTAKDASECQDEGDHPEVIQTLPTVRVNDPCGTANDSVVLSTNEDEYTGHDNGNGTATFTAEPGFVFPGGGTTYIVNYTMPTNVPCTSTVQIPSATPSDPCGPNNASWSLPGNTETFSWSLTNGVLSVAIIPQNVTFTDGTRTHSYGTATDSGAPCPQTQPTPVTPAVTVLDPCGTANDSYDVTNDVVDGVTRFTTSTSPITGGLRLTFTAAPGYVISGSNTFDVIWTNAPCVAGVEEISPDVTFIEPDCDNLDGADWSGTFTDVVDYAVAGTPGLGETVTVTATIKAEQAGDFAFPAGFDNTFDHTYVTEAELACPTVKGSESSKPKPHKPATQPTVLGTQAVAPTAVDAGLTGLPATGSSSNSLLAQLMVGGGLVLLLAGGWLGFGRREYGAHQA